MIDLGRPALHSEGVTLFPDHAEPTRFHYLPDVPRLAHAGDGSPELTLLKYQLDPALHDALGGGLLSLTVDLGVDDERLARLQGRLAAHANLPGPPVLAPVAPETGTCQLVLIDRSSGDDSPPAGAPGTVGTAGPSSSPTTPPPPGASGLVERIMGSATPSLYGDDAAVFFAVLSAEGASMIEKALRGGGLPAGVVYALQVTGLRPALRAVITARWQDAYSFYENRLHGGKLLLAADIGETIEKLVQSQAIHIQVDELVPPDETSATYQQALDQVQRYVLETLFQPSLGQAPPAQDEHADALAAIGTAIKDIAGFFSLTYSLRQTDRSELKTLTYQLAVARAERLTLAPQGTLGLLLGDGVSAADVDRRIVTVEAAAASEMQFDVGSLVDLAAEEIDHLDVFVRYGDRQETLVLDAANPHRALTFFYRPEVGPAVALRYEVQFRAASSRIAGSTDRLKAAEITTASRLIRLDPRELYQKVEVRAVAAGLPFDRFPSVLVDLQARDPATGWSGDATLELDAAHTEVSYRLRAALGSAVQLARRLRYADVHGSETVIDWDDAEPGVMVVGDPLPDVVDVQILGSARFGTVVQRLIVELRPHSAPDRVATRVLTAEQPAATWSWALPANAPDEDRGYDYRVTVHTTASEVREGSWLPGVPGKLVVGEGIARLRQVQLILVGKTPRDLGLLALKVRFAFDDPPSGLSAEDELLVDDTKAPIRWSYPVADPARQAYTYQLTLVHADGTIEARPPVTTSDLLAVQPLA